MITKLGAEIVSRSDKAELPATLYLGEGIVGESLLRNAISSGELTGRASLYHGTDRETAAKIREKGLLPTTAETAVNTRALEHADPERFKQALGKSYMTRNPVEAFTYGFGKKVRGGGGMPGVVRLNVPVWKMKSVVNPEVDMSFEEWKNKSVLLPGKPNFVQEKVLRDTYNKLRNSVVIDGAVGPEYVRGSAQYKGNSLKEFMEYMRARPKSFAAGTAKSLLGLGGSLNSGYEIYGRTLGKGRQLPMFPE